MMAKLTSRPWSVDTSYEYVDYDTDDERIQLMLDREVEPRRKPLTFEQFNSLLDDDGRLVDEHMLRKAVYLGGVEPCVRKEVWGFLFGLYPCSSTFRERDALCLESFVKYDELKSRWKKMLIVNSVPSATPIQQGLVAGYQIERNSQSSSSSMIDSDSDSFSEYDISIPVSPLLNYNYLYTYENLPFDLQNDEIRQQIDCMRLQAKLAVNRQRIEIKEMKQNIRAIDKDVPRTDRDYDYFKGRCNPHLSQLRDMLITFCAFSPTIGYVQGMNDIIARFLVVFNNEVEAFWCFKSYMSSVYRDFLEDGMMDKLCRVKTLLKVLDPDLLQFFKSTQMDDLMFCHRWVLLGFKREFSFNDSLRCFEILSCHHLELSSLEAEMTKHQEEMKEFENGDGTLRPVNLEYKTEFTFELFMCVALLISNRKDLMKCNDIADVFTVINNIEIDLDKILQTSEQLFFQYCQKAVEDCFLIINSPGSFPL